MRMPRYDIEMTEEAKMDLGTYALPQRKRILEQVLVQLGSEPLTETRNRKALRDNPVAPWELRIGKYRVFYYVGSGSRTVSVVAIGHKERNALYIRKQEVTL